MSNNQETEDSSEDIMEVKVADLAYHTSQAISDILTVLKHFKKDHYDSEGDELDVLLNEVEVSIDEIYELS